MGEDAGFFDPSARRLCPDGACVGVIGDDGRCSECGRSESEAEAAEYGAEESPAGAAEAPEEPGDLAGRALCPDGACLGVIGEDGRCRVCGRPEADSPE